MVAALALVVTSVWVEDRFPSENPQRVLLPRTQRWVTRPIVNALSRTFAGWVRSRLEAPYMDTGLSLDETLRRFLDPSHDFTERRTFAYRLARVGSPETLAALQQVLPSAPPEHQAYMADLIGKTCNPDAVNCLRPLLDSPDESVSQSTLRALGMIGGDEATTLLAAALGNSRHPSTRRNAAALALGLIDSPAARAALTTTLASHPDDELAACLLTSLGRQEFSNVDATFRHFLDDPASPADLRVAAVEALANSTADAAPFLLEKAAADNDPEVRASAAWTLSAHQEITELGPVLVDMTEREPDVDVRRRLYEAMMPQAELPAERLLPLIRSEEDIAARVAGFNVAGRLARQAPASPVAQTFDHDIVPELLRIASEPNSTNIRMRAVFALRQANTDAARQALFQVSAIDQPQVASAASHGLSPSRP